jgi:beta-N-acetylhexosaminidase
MTGNRPERPDHSRRHPRSKNPNEKLDRGPDFGEQPAARDDSPSPTQRHRLPTRAQPHRSRRRVAIVAGIILAVTLVAGGIFAGIHLTRTGHSAPSPTAAKPTGLPSHAMTPTATPPPLGCNVQWSVFEKMPIEQKVAQLLMVGVANAAEARQVVFNEHVGGIFIASWTDLSMLTNPEELKAIAGKAGPLGLAVSVDEEGGRVERLSTLIGSAPSARVLAKTMSPQDVYKLALDHGQKMRKLGITIDFAPVVDVTDAPDDTVIGDRSFSKNPAVVEQYAAEYANGLRAAGVLPVFKHFPGHGRASGDSHTGWVVTPPLADLRNSDLGPYRTLLKQPAEGVMIGHMQVPGLTGDDPASLSPAAVDLLRKGTGYGGPPFDGPVFTDDLSTMKAITERYTVPQAVFKALKAGADTALWVTNTELPAVITRLVAAVNDHELSMTDIEASVRRMAKAKALNLCGN